MKKHRRTRAQRNFDIALETFSARSERVQALDLSAQSPLTLTPARSTPRETIARQWFVVGLPEVLLHEDGPVIRRPSCTVVVDKHSRTIVSWHIS